MLSLSPASAFSFPHTLFQPPPLRHPNAHPRRSPHQISAAKKPSSEETVANQVEVMRSLEGWATENMLKHLKPAESSWKPQDFLPDSSKPLDEYMEEVRALRERTAELSDDYFVVLVGDMITEEALPTYQSAISAAHGFRPDSGADPGPWATWTRGWSSEENRHGDLLHTYLYLSGRVDMAMVQRTTQYLIASGMVLFNGRPGAQHEPYATAVYTSFQEGATAVSHGNTARLAKKHGDIVLARICGSITADEKRHQRAYAGMVRKLVEVDPNGAMLAIGEILRSRILMPAHLMYDGREPQTFRHFAAVAQRLGVYTGWDYADILEQLVGQWGLEKVEEGLTPEGRKEQEYVCGLPARIRRLQEGTDEKAKKMKPHPVKFSWIFDRELTLHR